MERFGAVYSDIEQLMSRPERRLALAYAGRDRRDALAVLWALDQRLGGLVAASREPQLGEIRLAWWRDSLDGLDRTRHEEPLLAAVQQVAAEHSLARDDLSRLTDGWLALLTPLPLSPDMLERYAADRGAMLFRLSAKVAGGAHRQAEAAGEAWALLDLAAHVSDPETAARARTLAAARLEGVASRWPRSLRPLAVLLRSATNEGRSPVYRTARTFWTGLTGW